jgi:hypothetical protein
MYTSHAHKSGDWWIVQCDQVPGAISQVAELHEAAFAQAEAIAFVLNVSATSIGVTVTLRPDAGPVTEEQVTYTEMYDAVLNSAGLTRQTQTALENVVSGEMNDTVPGSGGSPFSFAIGEVEATQLVEAGYANMVRDRLGGMTGVAATAAGRKILTQIDRQLSQIRRPRPAGSR